LIKKSKAKWWNWKTNKSNSLQLKYCNFARPTHLLWWRKKKREGRRKIVVGASLYHRCRHTLPHRVERDALLQMTSQKAINGHQKAPPKRRERFPLAGVCSARSSYYFWTIERPEYPWLHMIIVGKPRLKNQKYSLILGKKKSIPWAMR